MLSDKLLDILVCPRCQGDLRPDDRHELLRCSTCSRDFKVEQNIPIMIEPDERADS